jgi:hypothetical protein
MFLIKVAKQGAGTPESMSAHSRGGSPIESLADNQTAKQIAVILNCLVV